MTHVDCTNISKYYIWSYLRLHALKIKIYKGKGAWFGKRLSERVT